MDASGKRAALDASGKRAALDGQLAAYGKVAVAFSGGVDSSLLLAAAARVLGAENVVAVTASSALAPRADLQRAAWFCEDAGVAHIVVEADLLACDGVRANGVERCYHCKRELLSLVAGAACEAGFPIVADGANADDAADFRPGAKAARELGVRSPLADAGLTKEDVRALAREAELDVWDRASNACLATRVPYGEALDAGLLARIDAAEDYLRRLGFDSVRVRAHGDVARIEVAATSIARFAEPGVRMDVAESLKGLGFTYICVDLDGFRSGSMNETIAAAARP